jgi:serine phosphatase RsbU (regulator of sigma subunit)
MPRRLPVAEDTEFYVGRAVDCGMVIDDGAASRQHASITCNDGAFIWKDLGSTNGTLLNGARMLEGKLSHGDRMQIGETVLRFEIEEVEGDGVSAPDGSTVLKQTLLDWHSSDAGLGETPESAKAGDLLRAVYNVSNAIASNYEVCSLVDSVLQTTMNAVSAQRGAIMFTSGVQEELTPCPRCNKVHVIQDGELSHVDTPDFRISNTVAQRVISRGESVLYQDTDSETDSDLEAAASIVSLQLRSILCVPLRGKAGVVGVLYMDTNRQDQSYSHDDMLLATAVGNSAGLALENANLHARLLKQQRDEHEIEFAWSIQEGFLVKDWPQDQPHYDAYGLTRPAKTVGGDFYDFIQLGPDRVGILIGDVSGKGIPAALTMAQLLAEFRLLAREEVSPAVVVSHINRNQVQRSQRGMFCSLCFISIDLRDGKMTCVNAGHHPPMHATAAGVRSLDDASGMPVGVLPEAKWSDTHYKLMPGDSLVLYTDGIVEARGPMTQQEGEREIDEFGLRSLARIVRQYQGQPARELVETTNKRVLQYCAPGLPHDDCTMLVVRYLG